MTADFSILSDTDLDQVSGGLAFWAAFAAHCYAGAAITGLCLGLKPQMSATSLFNNPDLYRSGYQHGQGVLIFQRPSAARAVANHHLAVARP